MKNISLKQLRTLKTVAEIGRVTAAAEKLFVTPPAVTMQIKETESKLNVKLFSRTKGKMLPNDICMDLIDTLRQIDLLLDNFMQRLNSYKGVEGGNLNISGISTLKYFFPNLLAEFLHHYPGINLKLQIGNRREVIQSLEHHQADLCIMGRPPNGFAVRAEHIADHPHLIIAHPNHPLAKHKRILRKQLEGQCFLHRENDSGTRTVAEEFLHGIETKPSIFGDSQLSNESIKQAVMAGLGISLISAHTVTRELARGELCSLAVVGTPIIRSWYLVSRSARPLSPAAEVFIQYMKTEGAQKLQLLI